MSDRCKERLGGWRCDLRRTHAGSHEVAHHRGDKGRSVKRWHYPKTNARDAQEADAKDLLYSLGAP